MPRKTTKPAPPVILTAEQIEAKARRDAAADAYVAARYSSSRDTLVGKMRAAGLHVTYVKGSNDKWIVIVSYDSVNISTSGPRAARVINVVLAA